MLPSSRLLFSREVSRDYAEKHMQILLNRKYHCRKALILLRFHLPHNVDCVHVNVKIVKSTRVIREKGIVSAAPVSSAFVRLLTARRDCCANALS